jgi:DNA-binding NarL/FixJ family response regulator
MQTMRTVYIVDDSQAVRERLIAMISELGGTALAGAVDEPRETVKAIRRMHPNAVMPDIRMPRMSGIKLLKEIKRDQRAPVVIILTTYLAGQYRRPAVKAGADYFLNKSTEFEKMKRGSGKNC